MFENDDICESQHQHSYSQLRVFRGAEVVPHHNGIRRTNRQHIVSLHQRATLSDYREQQATHQNKNKQHHQMNMSSNCTEQCSRKSG